MSLLLYCTAVCREQEFQSTEHDQHGACRPAKKHLRASAGNWFLNFGAVFTGYHFNFGTIFKFLGVPVQDSHTHTHTHTHTRTHTNPYFDWQMDGM